MSLSSFLQSSSSARPSKGLFSNVNFGSPGGVPMGMFNNPLTQQARKLGENRTGLFQSLFPNTKMGPPTPQSPAMLAAGIAPRPPSALNEPAPFVGPVKTPGPRDGKLTPAGEKVAAKAALAQEAFRKKNEQPAPPPRLTRETMTKELTTGEKNTEWANQFVKDNPDKAINYGGLFAPNTPKGISQILAEGGRKTPGGLASFLAKTAAKKGASTLTVMGALGAKPRFPAV